MLFQEHTCRKNILIIVYFEVMLLKKINCKLISKKKTQIIFKNLILIKYYKIFKNLYNLLKITV